MFNFGNASPTQKILAGTVILFIVDLMLVASSELSEHIFKVEGYGKPYFTTYLKTSMFIVYLLGFLFHKSWWKRGTSGCGLECDESVAAKAVPLSNPSFVPTKGHESGGGTAPADVEKQPNAGTGKRAVRFSSVSEVRTMGDAFAVEAALARLSYKEYLRAERVLRRQAMRLSAGTVAKLALILCGIWFLANFAFQQALYFTEAGVVSVLWSMSGLFTLVLAAIWPSCGGDRFTLTKLVAVLFSISGIVMVCFSDRSDRDVNRLGKVAAGACWALAGAFLYAFYLVLLKRQVDRQDKLSIPMFFGFVGLFSTVMLWPGLVVAHYAQIETFQWPTQKQMLLVLINGFVGTMVAELLWLWGCFLTSSVAASLAVTLTTPLTMIVDIYYRKDNYSWMFYVGAVPVLLSYFTTTALSYYENYDPVLAIIKQLCSCLLRTVSCRRYGKLEKEQAASLLASVEDGYSE